MSRRWRAAALGVALAGLLGALPATAAPDTQLRVVTTLPAPAGSATTVVAEVRPTPTAPPPPDAADVTVAGARVPATTSRLLESGARTSIVVDASSAGAAQLPQVLSATAGYLLAAPQDTPLTVVADGTPPRALTPAPVAPVDAIPSLAGVRAAGLRSTTDALGLALRGMPASGSSPGAARSLVILQTGGPAPAGTALATLAEQLRAARAVLAVVTTPALAPGWARVAEPTGGMAVAAGRGGVTAAFDEVSSALQARCAVTFTPPAGATSASLRLRSGGTVLSALVPLAAASPPASVVAVPPLPQQTSSAPASAPPMLTAVVVALGLASVAVIVVGSVLASAVVRRRRGTPAVPVPPAVPLSTSAAVPVEPDGVPAGVRVFDVSDPGAPVELGGDPPRDPGKTSAPGQQESLGEDPALHDRSA